MEPEYPESLDASFEWALAPPEPLRAAYLTVLRHFREDRPGDRGVRRALTLQVENALEAQGLAFDSIAIADEFAAQVAERVPALGGARSAARDASFWAYLLEPSVPINSHILEPAAMAAVRELDFRSTGAFVPVWACARDVFARYAAGLVARHGELGPKSAAFGGARS